jgi:hypothetical protein
MQQIIESSIKSIARQTIIEQLKLYTNTKKLSEICQVVENKIINDENEENFTYDNNHIYISKQSIMTFCSVPFCLNIPCHYTIILNDYSEKMHKFLIQYLNIAGWYIESMEALLDLDVLVLDETNYWHITILNDTNKCIVRMLDLC